jgi:hypothetical protein
MPRRCTAAETPIRKRPALTERSSKRTDVRSAAQRAEARRVAADEHRLAAQMKHDRLAEEAAIKPAGAASLSEPPTAAASGGNGHLAGKKKKASAKSKSTAVKSTTDFVAIDPSTRKPGRKH